MSRVYPERSDAMLYDKAIRNSRAAITMTTSRFLDIGYADKTAMRIFAKFTPEASGGNGVSADGLGDAMTF
jgi:hypothetical protein